jgi:hypothetical protein
MQACVVKRRLFSWIGATAGAQNRPRMDTTFTPPALRQFIDEELLRAPLLFDQMVDGTLDATRKALPGMSPMERGVAGELTQSLLSRRGRLAEYFVHSLKEQVQTEIARRGAPLAHTPRPQAPSSTLALVDEAEAAVDVELSHTIKTIKDTAEYELRELQTFVSALVGDMDVSRDHNPLGAESYARALWAAAHALPLTAVHRVTFMRHAGPALAQVLRRAYAAATSRLEQLGVEPAAYRTLIVPSGSRRGGRGDSPFTTFSPDLHGMRSRMTPSWDTPSRQVDLSYEGQAGDERLRQIRFKEIALAAATPLDRQSVELVSRLFDAIDGDHRIAQDVRGMLAKLHAPAMRLALRDPALLDDETHPLWVFVNRLAYEAEMSPDAGDPERARLLRVGLTSIEQVAAQPEQGASHYRWASERLLAFLQQRLGRKLQSVASQVGALQKLEDRLCASSTVPSTLHGTLDVPQLDTVPAELMGEPPAALAPQSGAGPWLESLEPGDWLRIFMQGRWLQVQLLWPGERREIWLLGDGGSDATWAVRRRALLMLHDAALFKRLKQRSVLRSAAYRVQQQVAGKDTTL